MRGWGASRLEEFGGAEILGGMMRMEKLDFRCSMDAKSVFLILEVRYMYGGGSVHLQSIGFRFISIDVRSSFHRVSIDVRSSFHDPFWLILKPMTVFLSEQRADDLFFWLNPKQITFVGLKLEPMTLLWVEAKTNELVNACCVVRFTVFDATASRICFN